MVIHNRVYGFTCIFLYLCVGLLVLKTSFLRSSPVPIRLSCRPLVNSVLGSFRDLGFLAPLRQSMCITAAFQS